MSSKKFYLIATFIMLTTVCFAEVQPNNSTAQRKFPYHAQATGLKINMRAGANTSFYECGMINKPDTVIVVADKNGWTTILPPKGAFSWIETDSIKIDSVNKNIGVVTETASVYAGSETTNPLYSGAEQIKLNPGDQVTLLGQTKNIYSKIAPPTGAYLYISTRFLTYLGPVEKKPFDPTKTEVKKEDAKPETDKTESPVKDKVETPDKTETDDKVITEPEPIKEVIPVKKVVKPKNPQETKRLLQCRELSNKIEAELEKSANLQNFKPIRKQLDEIIKDPKAGKAKSYAQYQLNMVTRFELALEAGRELQQQQEQLDKLRREIKQKLAKSQSKLPLPDKYIITGKIRPSQIYTAKSGQARFLIIDKVGKIAAYAVPAPGLNLSAINKLTGEKIGIVGQIDKDQKSTIPMIRFTAIEKL